MPKIIDFGLAKAMHQSLTEKTLHTAHESVLGTPLYISPEHAQLNNLDTDARMLSTTAPDFAESKVNRLVENIAATWNRTAATRERR